MWLESIEAKNVRVSDLVYLSDDEKKGVTQLLDFITYYLKLTFEAILYGSKARGDYTIDSDIDLIIISDSFTSPKLKNELIINVRKINKTNNILLSPRIATINDLNNPCKYGGTFKQNVITDGKFIINI
ncbi:hypothetical protein ABD87_22660 [Lysinibacillus sphaericus]|uniref:nucleotidyltransferase domain-containing protein n=1 Tax=Lysinibacillus sphaericus TaxID=1421 RepID=UPI0018CD8251|nr:nucleotidyltransferase domain-containing protein [Lysinibacillus sphaericus]MBG9732229.1 hypothetical protein [Lysinibacillus sphaericus]